MMIFNGTERAIERLRALKQHAVGKNLKIAAVLFAEDAASKLYTRLKKEAAEQVGIAYDVYEFSLADGTAEIEAKLRELNDDTTVTGIIIQKPYRSVWTTVKGIDTTQGPKAVRQAYASWWRFLTSNIAINKDVDGLHPSTLSAVENGTWQEQKMVLPATARGVLLILEEAFEKLAIATDAQKKLTMFVLGRSDIVGLPVFYELRNRGCQVKLLTRDDLEQRRISGRHLTDGDVIISATGVKHLITGEMVKDNTIVIDVGEPSPDVEFATVESKAAFITPVPGGVGPMTVVCLLENCVALTRR